MDFMYIMIFSVVLAIVLFSSGITIFSSALLEFIVGAGKRNKVTGWIAGKVVSFISVTGRIRRAWIRMISPGN